MLGGGEVFREFSRISSLSLEKVEAGKLLVRGNCLLAGDSRRAGGVHGIPGLRNLTGVDERPSDLLRTPDAACSGRDVGEGRGVYRARLVPEEFTLHAVRI